MTKNEQIISRIKKIAFNLISLTFPKCNLGEDQDLVLLKSSEMLIDGYTLIVYFSIADYSIYKVKTLQIYPKNHYFLPFNISCKLAKKFLGSKNLSLLDMFSGNKKIHCWSVVENEKGEMIENPYELKSKIKKFENLKYYLMRSDEVNFL